MPAINPICTTVSKTFVAFVKDLQDNKKTLTVRTNARAKIKSYSLFESICGANYCRRSKSLYRYIHDLLPNEIKESLTESNGNLTYQLPADKNFPKPASMLRRWLNECKRNHAEYMELCESRGNPLKTLSDILAIDVIDQFTSKIKDRKYSPLERYMAEFVAVTNGVNVKAHISNVWPKYRGMFGDHNSCYYPTREYGYCSRAVEQYGWIVRLYDESVSDEAIYANPDNPLNVAEPLNNMPDADDDLPFRDDEIENTDGCVGRCLVLHNHYPYTTLSVLNAYCHTKKKINIIKDDVAEMLVDGMNKFQFPDTDPQKLEDQHRIISVPDCRVSENQGMYINNDRSVLLTTVADNQSGYSQRNGDHYRIHLDSDIRALLSQLLADMRENGEDENVDIDEF